MVHQYKELNMEALSWLGQFFDALLSLIPHIKIVRSTHLGVRFTAGRYPKLMSPENGLFKTGIHFYWPVITEVEVVPIKRQTVNLVPQYVETRDDVPVGVSGIVVYEVNDVVKLLTESFEYDDTVKDFALAAIKNAICSHNYEYIKQNSQEFDEILTESLEESLQDYGINVITVTLTDFTKCRVYALWGAG